MTFHNDCAQSLEMVKDFVRVFSAKGGAVNSHRSEKMLILLSICFGELHVTVGCNCRTETMQNAWCKIV